MEKKIIINLLKNLLIIFYSQLVILEIILRQTIFKQKFLFALGGFGDLLIFLSYFQNKKTKYKFLNIGSVAGKVMKLIIPNNRVLNIPLLENDTENVINFVLENNSEKKIKKRYFWNLLKNE